MPRRQRPRPRSLRLPDHFDPSKALADADAAYAAALKDSREAGKKIPEARAKLRAERAADVAPSVIRKLEQTAEDSEHRYREAKRAVEQAQAVLADAIHRDRRALVEQVPIEDRAEQALTRLAEVATDVDLLAEQAGSVRTVLTIREDRTQVRGFEPIRLASDIYESPQAHLAALHGQIIELRDIARRLAVQAEQTSKPAKRQKVAA